MEVDNPQFPEAEAEGEKEGEKERKWKVFIGDVLHEVEEADIQEFCAAAGVVRELKYCRCKKRAFFHAFVSYDTHKEATWAVQNQNGASLCGGVVRVFFCSCRRAA